ncbi:hypothetical protein HY988_05550 [Candidatus Micrarchaeota archaeon]|nr:hypothetical protein [Candidatus Micrarchaeota archaeon]
MAQIIQSERKIFLPLAIRALDTPDRRDRIPTTTRDPIRDNPEKARYARKSPYLNEAGVLDEELMRRDIRELFACVTKNVEPAREIVTELFSPSFDRSYRYALKVFRNKGKNIDVKKSSRRLNGRATLSHSFEAAGNVLGFLNTYGILGSARPIITPYEVLKFKSDEIIAITICAAILHDVVEDVSKTPEQIERNFKALEQMLRPFGKEFAEEVLGNVRLLTNCYTLMRKWAFGFIPKRDQEGIATLSPVERVLIGFERAAEAATRGRYSKYTNILEKLAVELEKLHSFGGSEDGQIRAAYRGHTRTEQDIENYLVYKEYNYFMLDLLSGCFERFRSPSDGGDIPLLIKVGGDALNNLETTDSDDMDKIRKMLGKIEIVLRALDSDERVGAEPFLHLDGRIHLGWIQHLRASGVNQAYIQQWEGLSFSSRCAIIANCRGWIKELDHKTSHSSRGTMGPFLRRKEAKYLHKYGIDPKARVGVVRENPLGELWEAE